MKACFLPVGLRSVSVVYAQPAARLVSFAVCSRALETMAHKAESICPQPLETINNYLLIDDVFLVMEKNKIGGAKAEARF
jgi:hypothetical protein